jgi:hypothetical protein
MIYLFTGALRFLCDPRSLINKIVFAPSLGLLPGILGDDDPFIKPTIHNHPRCFFLGLDYFDWPDGVSDRDAINCGGPGINF